MSSVEGGDLQLVVDGDRMLVEGARPDIDGLLERLGVPVEESRLGVATGVSELGAAAATAGAVAAATRELYQLTPAGKALLDQFGVAENAAGHMSGVVRRGGSSIAGHLSFDQVSMGAEQAVALQTAAVAIALRSAIADVKKAVEEVDGKVEDLQQRLRAEEIGEVIGVYRDLEQVVDRTQRIGRLLDADWDSVDTGRRDLVVALERLRAYATNSIRSTPVSADLPDRVKAVDQLSSAQSVAGTLQLIAVAEQALHLWHYLYIERVRMTDPEHVSEAVASARTVLDQNRKLDETLVALMVERVTELGDVRPLEVHRRGSIRKMDLATESAHASITTFAERTRTPLPELVTKVATRPTFAEARGEVKARAIEARDVGADLSREVAGVLKDRTAEQVKKVRRRSSADDSSADEI